MTLRFPSRLHLAQLPTPLQYGERISRELGVEIWFKRDDLTGSALSGNKIRKLEYLLAEAKAEDATHVITGGGEQSNHCRATAVAAARLGLNCTVLLRTEDPAHPPRSTGNILLDRLVGANIEWITPAQWSERHLVMTAVAERLASAGERPYVIPEGGSNATGAWGYVGLCQELAADLRNLPSEATSLISACGSAGTSAGLLLGRKLTSLSVHELRSIAVNVCDNREYFVERISSIAAAFADKYGLAVHIPESEIEILDGYVGRGYAKSRPEELADLVHLARTEGIVLDPVYTGKAWHALVSELRRDPQCFGNRVIFLHTGGIFGLMGDSPDLLEAL